jgi:hypothetical protein
MATKTTKKGKVKPKADAADQLKDFMIDGLKDLYWAEKALEKSPENAQKCNIQKSKSCHCIPFGRNQRSGKKTGRCLQSIEIETRSREM